MILIYTILAGALNTLRGSGKLRGLPQFLLRWLLIPAAITLPAYYIGHSIWLFCAALPYYFKICTGTGGDMQARTDNAICDLNNTKEFVGFDRIAALLARIKIGNLNYCQCWGIWFCALTAGVYSLPFILTNYIWALPLFIYPVMVRYFSVWRVVEFGFMALYAGLFLCSI